jgi:DNA polymerase-3 subunit beta
MKLQVTQENLNRALGSVSRIANGRSTLPILSNILFKTIDNRLSIAATNLDIAVTHYIGSKVAEEGSITLPARLLQDFVSSLPSGVIDIKLDETKLHIKTDQYQSTINGTLADEYPVMPAISDGQTWQVPVKEFKQALQQVVFAASNDETRPVLTGIYMHVINGSLYIAATDSYRLAEKQLATKQKDLSLLVPATALQEVLRIMGDHDEEVAVTHDDQQVQFKIGDVELVARLIDGNYPDYQKLIPNTFAAEAEIERSELGNITKVSALFARESAGSITIKLDAEKQTVSIHSIASQLGENTASATAKITGDGEITLNSRYLLDALNAMHGQQVRFSFNGKLEPSVLRDTSDESYTHIIMPLKS